MISPKTERFFVILLTVGVAVLVYMLSDKTKTVKQLQREMVRNHLKSKLEELDKKAKKSRAKAEESYDAYTKLLATYPEYRDLIKRNKPTKPRKRK